MHLYIVICQTKRRYV